MWEPRTVRLLTECSRDVAALRRARPLSPSAPATIRNQLCTTLTDDSNAIEGNPLSLRVTTVMLEGQTVQGKPLRDHLKVVELA